jgi:DNA invertase Pin-like site-specific DNA recombinase
MPLRTKNYKLSHAQVVLIKQMLRTGKNRIKMIAKQFGITSTQVNRIKSGANWKQVHLK